MLSTSSNPTASVPETSRSLPCPRLIPPGRNLPELSPGWPVRAVALGRVEELPRARSDCTVYDPGEFTLCSLIILLSNIRKLVNVR